jgi:hypothetical protein
MISRLLACPSRKFRSSSIEFFLWRVLQLQKFLERRFPSLIGSIDGANYPPPFHAQVSLSCLSASLCPTCPLYTCGADVTLPCVLATCMNPTLRKH